MLYNVIKMLGILFYSVTQPFTYAGFIQDLVDPGMALEQVRIFSPLK